MNKVVMNKVVKKKSSEVNYETEWKHECLEPQQYLYFEPNTPIEEIVLKLEDQQNKLYPDLNVNHKRSVPSFKRLYRNLIPIFKGWQVFYRKPGSKKPFGPINEQIAYKSRSPKRAYKSSLFKAEMRWTHELYPLIDRVEIKNVASYETIAKHLNEKLEKPSYKLFFEQLLEPYLVGLSETCCIVHQKSINFDCQKADQNTCQSFFENLKTMYNYAKYLNFLMTKDYVVRSLNVSDVLQKTTSQTAKGWRVEFLKGTNNT